MNRRRKVRPEGPKGCPFCGNRANPSETLTASPGAVARMSCEACGAMGPEALGFTAEEAVAGAVVRWNKRCGRIGAPT